MATFAYLLLPLSGIVAYLDGGSVRARMHGLQAILFGTAWPLALYAASALSSGATKIVFGVGAVAWMIFLVGTLVGRDPVIPGLRGALERAAADPLKEPG
jgi:hypothetical protein